MEISLKRKVIIEHDEYIKFNLFRLDFAVRISSFSLWWWWSRYDKLAWKLTRIFNVQMRRDSLQERRRFQFHLQIYYVRRSDLRSYVFFFAWGMFCQLAKSSWSWHLFERESSGPLLQAKNKKCHLGIICNVLFVQFSIQSRSQLAYHHDLFYSSIDSRKKKKKAWSKYNDIILLTYVSYFLITFLITLMYFDMT